MKIANLRVYDLRESIIACRYAMKTELPEYTSEEYENALERAKKLCRSGSPHCNFRTGIRVSFDIVYPNYISPQMQRYHWYDIVSSNSKMHRIMHMDFDKCCNKYVTSASIAQMKRLIKKYKEDPTEDNFMMVLSNCPQGILLFMRVSTNYEQLTTIYRQRNKHKLPEWREFTEWIKTLPLAEELIICEKP